jgi:hypothetical protein
MQENKAEISSVKQTPVKEAKNKELLIKLIKLQITSIKVTSLAQALNVIKNLPDKEKATTIITFNIILLQSKDKVKDVIIS